VRIGRDGRLGLRLSEPGTGRPVPALAYRELGEEQAAAAEREERRLFYVAMTRARERLILSGASKLDAWDAERSPIGWIAPALGDAGVEASYVQEGFAPENASRAGGSEPARASGPSQSGGPGGSGQSGWAAQPRLGDICHTATEISHDDALAASARGPLAPEATVALGSPVTRLSYSGLGEYGRCGYRFYVERVLGVPPVPATPSPPVAIPGVSRAGATGAAPLGLTPVERGILVHTLLEKLDFRRPVAPTAAEVTRAAERPPGGGEADQIAALIRLFIDSEMRARLGAATDVRREVRFAFQLWGDVLINGAIDVLAREPAGRMLVVDYKSDRLEGADPGELVLSHYATQRLVYALAALRAGARQVEVAHLFLEAPREPVVAAFTESDVPRLERELSDLAAGVLRRHFVVAEQPHRGICDGCPAEGGLCSWPLAMTRREAPDRLF
jgi:ATP-dependent helicase/nuclease subunit A